MKPNDAGKNKSLQSQTANQKYRNETCRHKMLKLCKLINVLYMTVKGYISKIILLLEGVGSETSVPHVSAEALATRHTAL